MYMYMYMKIFSFPNLFCSYESKHYQVCICLRVAAQCLRISTARVRSLWTSNVPILTYRSNWLRLEAVRYCELLYTWNCIKHSQLKWDMRACDINSIVCNTIDRYIFTRELTRLLQKYATVNFLIYLMFAYAYALEKSTIQKGYINTFWNIWYALHSCKRK